MSKFLIGLTVSSLSVTDPILITQESFPDSKTFYLRLPTLWIWENSRWDGVDARILEYTSFQMRKEGPLADIWSASIFWPRGISDEEWERIDQSAHLLNLLFGEKKNPEVSLTIVPMESAIRQMEIYHQVGATRSTLREMWFVDIYKQALFERRMPRNANFSFTSYDHTRTPVSTFMDATGLRVL